MKKINTMLANLRSAISRLQDFLKKPVVDDRDQAGVIQAFEFSFELFWKAFQKIARTQGLMANSPKEAFKMAFQLNLIHPLEEKTWLDMLEDRNLTVHLYDQSTAEKIFIHVKENYAPLFQETLKRIETQYP